MSEASGMFATRRVDMWFAGSSPQDRWTVGFRIILAIPQYIVLVFLYIAAVIAAVIGWFGALFMGRLPGWAHEFLSGVVRWATRVGAYLFLLTDRYPPFSLEDEAYPVRPMMPPPGPLNRVTVLFRFILAFPAYYFSMIVSYGLTFPLLIVMWFVVLIRGTMPPTFYLCYGALLRYQLRYYSWFAMLTSEYAWGMLGDRVAPPSAVPPPYPAQPAMPPSGPPAMPPSGPPAMPPSGPPPAAPAPPAAPPQPYSYPGGQATPSGPPGPPPGQPPPPPQPAAPASPQVPPGGPGAMPPPSPWERVAPPPVSGTVLPPWGTLVLEGSARGWMIFAIVWGSVLLVAEGSVQSAVSGTGNNQNTNYQYLGVHHGGSATAEGRAGLS